MTDPTTLRASSEIFHVQWHILDRCNLRCRHCYQEGFDRRNELDIAGLCRVGNNLLHAMEKWNMLLSVAITGGEPLLKAETFELLEYLDRSVRTERISLITNGVLLEANAERLKRLSKLREIMISLDGASATAHDAIRGNGVFSTVIRSIEKMHPLEIPMVLMFTVMKSNFGEVIKLLPLARQLGLRGFIVERFFPLGQGKEMQEEVLSGPEFLKVWRILLDQAETQATDEELIAFRGIRVSIEGRLTDIFGSGCVVGRDGAAIMPDGTLFPCRRFPRSLGNLQETCLTEIWKTATLLRDVRDRTRLGGRCGYCRISECIGCRAMSLALTGECLAEDPHCWLPDASTSAGA